MTRFARLSAGSCIALLALTVAGAVRAQTAHWDQAKVTAISGDLVSAVANLQNNLQNSAQAGDPAMEELVYQVGDTLGLIEFEATRLNALLQSGRGMKATLATYKRLQQLHREATDEAQGQMQVSAFIAPPLAKAKAALALLSAYYPPQ